jgi:hypothetical protein
VTCFGTKAKRSEEVVRQEPRFVESSMFGQWDRLGRHLPFETTGSLPPANSLGV